LLTLQCELAIILSKLQWIINAYIMFFVAMMLTMRVLGDCIGHAGMLQIGIVVITGASLAAAFANMVVSRSYGVPSWLPEAQ